MPRPLAPQAVAPAPPRALAAPPPSPGAYMHLEPRMSNVHPSHAQDVSPFPHRSRVELHASRTLMTHMTKRTCKRNQLRLSCLCAFLLNFCKSDVNQSELSSCVASGFGRWLEDSSLKEPYLLSPTLYTPAFFTSRWFWGSCDHEKILHYYKSPNLLPVRRELQYSWQPNCSHLLQGSSLPSYSQLRREFCSVFRGRSILFVGDSLSGQFFSSFISIFGVQWATVNNASENGCYLGFSATNFWKEVLNNAHEIDAEARICKSGELDVKVRFMRNDWLSTGDLTRVNGVSCDWFTVASDYDIFILNRGIHFVDDEVFAIQLQETLTNLRHLKNTARVIYRGSHHSTPNCAELRDPQPTPLSSPNDTVSLSYHWDRTEIQNQIARVLVEKIGGTFIGTFFAFSLRPGGRRLPDCLHFCLPSPMDEFVRVLLAYLIKSE